MSGYIDARPSWASTEPLPIDPAVAGVSDGNDGDNTQMLLIGITLFALLVGGYLIYTRESNDGAERMKQGEQKQPSDVPQDTASDDRKLPQPTVVGGGLAGR